MATQPGLYQTPATPPPNWVSRNWKWFVPAGLITLFLLLAAFVGSIFLIVETSFQHSECYVQALARARANQQVVEKIGQPFTAGWLATGNINISGPSGKADIAIPIRGPKRRGTIYVVATKRAGEWTFQTLRVEIQGDPQRIELLKTEPIVPTEN
jgi:hypothetical protein